jgi:hypothetical protein
MDTNILIGVIGLIVAIAGYSLAKQTFNKEHVEKPEEDKTNLIANFNAVRNLSIDVKNRLEKYAQEKSAYDEQLWPGVTIGQYIKLLQESQDTNLSPKLLNDLTSLPLSSANIELLHKELEPQKLALLEIQGWVKMKSID